MCPDIDAYIVQTALSSRLRSWPPYFCGTAVSACVPNLSCAANSKSWASTASVTTVPQSTHLKICSSASPLSLGTDRVNRMALLQPGQRGVVLPFCLSAKAKALMYVNRTKEAATLQPGVYYLPGICEKARCFTAVQNVANGPPRHLVRCSDPVANGGKADIA